MSEFSITYNKVNEGYKKIKKCIDSSETADELHTVYRLMDSWVHLLTYYYKNIKREWDNPRRFRDARMMSRTIQEMLDDIANDYNIKKEPFENPEQCEYTCSFKPHRVRTHDEISHENIYLNKLNEYDDME